jgi:tripartite-type tricarboxylate transporter receptor subunit TctC
MFGWAQHHRSKCLRVLAILTACACVLPAAAQGFAAQLLVPSNAEGISLLVADVLSQGASNEAYALHLNVRAEPTLTAEAALRHLNASPADGRTLLVLSSRAYDQLPAAEATKAVARIAAVPYLLLSAPTRAYSWDELAQLGKHRSGAIAIAVNGRDELARGGVARLMQLAGIDTRSLAVADPYTTLSAPLTRAADAAFEEAHTAMPYVRSRRLAAVVTTSDRRLPVLPAVAAASEIASGYELTKWIGIFAHANTPASEVARLNAEIERLLRSLAVRVTLTNLGLVTTSIDKEQFEKQVRQNRTLTAGHAVPETARQLR